MARPDEPAPFVLEVIDRETDCVVGEIAFSCDVDTLIELAALEVPGTGDERRRLGGASYDLTAGDVQAIAGRFRIESPDGASVMRLRARHRLVDVSPIASMPAANSG